MSFFFDFFDQLVEARLHLLNGAGGQCDGSTFGHDELSHDVVGGNGWEKDEGQMLATQHAEHDHENGYEKGGGCVTEING